MDENENKMQEQEQEQVDTATTETEVVDTPKDTTETNNDGTTNFTQEQVNNIVRERLEKERKSVYTRYGVETKEQLDDLVGKSQAYDIVNEKFEALQENYKNLNQEYAFIKNNINPERYDDIKIYFKGKELELNNDNLFNEISTHPEWLKQETPKEKPQMTIQKISPDREAKHTETEREKAMKLFGF